MALRLEDKKAVVASVNEVAASSLSVVIADYRGLTVSEMTKLRAQAREQGVYLRVVRNTLARLAVKGTEFECTEEALVGPTVLAFALEEPGSAARLIKDFAKDHEALEVKALAIGGKLLSANQIDSVAKLPTKDQAIAILMSLMQAPVTKLTRTLNEVPTKLVRAVAAVRDQKQEAA